jgi:hypothetical protein
MNASSALRAEKTIWDTGSRGLIAARSAPLATIVRPPGGTAEGGCATFS